MNSNFLRRLKFYGIGFGMGLILVFFFFKNRGCSWTPGNRVKNTILSRVITVNDVEFAFMKSKKITKEDILSALNDGDVNFSESKKTGKTKVYAIDKSFSDKGTIRFYFTIPDESFISEVKFAELKASNVKNTISGYGRFIHFPVEKHLIYADTTKLVTCQQEQMGLITDLQLQAKIEKSAFIDFSKSKLSKRPKPEHYLYFLNKSDTIGFTSTWYKNKVCISNFDLPGKSDCK